MSPEVEICSKAYTTLEPLTPQGPLYMQNVQYQTLSYILYIRTCQQYKT